MGCVTQWVIVDLNIRCLVCKRVSSGQELGEGFLGMYGYQPNYDYQPNYGTNSPSHSTTTHPNPQPKALEDPLQQQQHCNHQH